MGTYLCKTTTWSFNAIQQLRLVSKAATVVMQQVFHIYHLSGCFLCLHLTPSAPSLPAAPHSTSSSLPAAPHPPSCLLCIHLTSWALCLLASRLSSRVSPRERELSQSSHVCDAALTIRANPTGLGFKNVVACGGARACMGACMSTHGRAWGEERTLA